MSKRFIPREYGERKRPKLDHNLPLSQNTDVNNGSGAEEDWGNDGDDEILLLASQACEDAQQSILPDYSLCMQPQTTSTQYETGNRNIFKKPIPSVSGVVSTSLKEKCNRISSPLPGITSKLIQNNQQIDLADDFMFNDKVFKQDSDTLCRKLAQMKEENETLQSENVKLLDKCFLKEGEVTILRSHLRNSQIALDNARMEKIKALEQAQKECTEKIDKVNRDMNNFKTQLEFKNSEIISIKEKCKILESSKVKLTQVNFGNNDISMSQKHKSILQNNFNLPKSKKVKTVSNAVQTMDKSHFLKLNKSKISETNSLKSILPHILQTSSNQNYSILDYNEKLQKHTDLSQNKCRVYNTFHRIPSTPIQKEDKQSHVDMSYIYKDVSSIAVERGDMKEKYFKVFKVIHSVLVEVQTRLEKILQKISPAFQKEMDEKYIETTLIFHEVKRVDLLKGVFLYKEEQEILARRMTAVMAYILENSRCENILGKYEDFCVTQNNGQFIPLLARICSLIDSTSCATIYSGLLLSINLIIETQIPSNNPKFIEIIKNSVTSRPSSFVCCHILNLMTKLSSVASFKKTFCSGDGGNLKIDYDQGVLLYKKDSCYLQILIRQIEVCLKCIENQHLVDKAIEITRNLIILHNNTSCDGVTLSQSKKNCDCQLLLMQTTVYALRICAVMLRNSCETGGHEVEGSCGDLLPICRCGVHIVYKCVLKDAEFSSQLLYSEGHLIEFCEIMKDMVTADVHVTMLSEIMGTLQLSPDEVVTNKQVWLDSFNNFTISD